MGPEALTNNLPNALVPQISRRLSLALLRQGCRAPGRLALHWEGILQHPTTVDPGATCADACVLCPFLELPYPGAPSDWPRATGFLLLTRCRLVYALLLHRQASFRLPDPGGCWLPCFSHHSYSASSSAPTWLLPSHWSPVLVRAPSF